MTDEVTDCSVVWTTVPCPVVSLADGIRFGMLIENYTHTGPRNLTLEWIEYPAAVAISDGSIHHYVALED